MNNNGILPELITPKEVKAYLGCNDVTLYALLKQKDFPSFRVGKRFYINRERFIKWMERKEHSEKKCY